jgi:hypothetical protein
MRRFGAWPAWAFMALFFAVPLAALLPEAFGEGGSAFGRLFGNPLFPGALRNTLGLGWRRARSRRWWAPASRSNWRASPKAGANG